MRNGSSADRRLFVDSAGRARIMKRESLFERVLEDADYGDLL